MLVRQAGLVDAQHAVNPGNVLDTGAVRCRGYTTRAGRPLSLPAAAGLSDWGAASLALPPF